VYIDVDDNTNITVAHIDKENLNEETDREKMMTSTFRDNITFLDSKLFSITL
jgi:hypothetical protein